MRRENRLPIFKGSPRFTGKQTEPAGLVQGDLPMHAKTTEAPKPSAPLFATANPPLMAPEAAGTRAASPPKRKRRWLAWLNAKLFGRPGIRTDFVQTELTLENIRVLRNDLANSDLELVMKKKRAAKPGAEPPRPGRPQGIPPRTSTWNELTARLFEIGQQ
jgi:hypothetical protein